LLLRPWLVLLFFVFVFFLLVAFFWGVRMSAPAGCSPQACGGVGILLQRLYIGYESS
jgi:hypothetical protein